MRNLDSYLFKSTQGATKLIKTTIASVVLLLISLTGVQAQEVVNTAGGEASGSGGTVSYSVGQVFYTTTIGTNGSVAAGVQQAYVISTILGIEHTLIKLSVYPNPTTDVLNLEVGDFKDKKLTYQLYDQQGKLLVDSQLTDKNTIVKMAGLSSSTYILKVSDTQATVKTFKIVKK